MTTFQDPPPQSRRSARQNERGEDQAETPFYGQFSSEQPPVTGRRARPGAPEQYDIAPEPLNYSTQGREPASYDSQLPAAGYAPAPQEPTAYRVRDFSPEGGRRAAAQPFVEPQQPAYPAGASDLEYRTQAQAPAPAPAPAPVPLIEPNAQPLLSRRELRQRQAASDAAAAQNPVPPIPQPQLRTAPPPQFPAQSMPPAVRTMPPPVQAAPSTMTAPPPAGAPSTTTAPPAAQDALSTAMAEFALARSGNAAPTFIEPELEQTGGWIAPVGHWSRQADLDDETQPWENTITRDVGGGNVATTTSALVLPEIPRLSSFSSALDSTGEVMLTGSIDLPPGLGTGGGDSRRYDDPNVDHMYDVQDAEFTGTDSSPVRAISAVSTHTSSRGVIHANKPHGNRMIVVVFVATAVLAVGVVGMFVASLMLDLF